MLKKFFIKDFENTKDIKVRNQYAKVSGIFGIVSNLLIGVIKLIFGFISNSISILADAVNNLSDMASSILVIIGFHLSSKKANSIHPYGYARYEYLFGFIIAFLMFIMGLSFLYSSILKVFNPTTIDINIYTYIVLLFAIFIKSLQMIVYLDFAHSISSNTLKTNAIDTRNDIISTSVILISMLIMQIFNINIDGLLGCIVSIFIIYSSVIMIKENVKPLIGVVPTKKEVDKIKKKLLSYDCVLGVHDLAVHNYGVNSDFIVAHVELDSRMSLLEAHDLVDKIENDFKEEFNTLITIHIDPLIIGNKKLDKIKNNILNELKKLNKKIEIHDFRMINGKYKIKLLFDVVIPFECNYSYKYLIKYLESNISFDKEVDYYIEVERPYC